MKIHSIVDCITNSSSEIFIIGLYKIPENPQDLHEILFPNNEKTVKIYNEDIDTKIISEDFFNAIQKGDHLESKKQLEKHMQKLFGYYDGAIPKDILKFWKQVRGLNVFLLDFTEDYLAYEDIYKNIKHKKVWV